MVLALDIGGTHIRTGMIDGEGKVGLFDKRLTASVVRDPVIPNLARFVRGIVPSDRSWERTDHIVMGIPSIIAEDNDYVLSTPNVPLLENLRLRHELSQALDKRVTVLNDVNLSTLGEYSLLDKAKHRNVVAVYIGTGLGCGLILNGRLYTGSSNLAAEFGHIPTRITGTRQRCNCGLWDCLEAYASGTFLERRLKASGEDLRLAEIFVRPDQDPRKGKIVDTFFDYLSFGIHTILTVLNPSLLIVGGGVVNMEGFPRQRVVEAAFSRLRHPYLRDRLEVKFAELGERAFVFGSRELDDQQRDEKGG
jgi:allose kinase